MNEDLAKRVEIRMSADKKAQELSAQILVLRNSILEISKSDEWKWMEGREELWKLFKDLSKAASTCNKQAFSKWSMR